MNQSVFRGNVYSVLNSHLVKDLRSHFPLNLLQLVLGNHGAVTFSLAILRVNKTKTDEGS